MSSLPDYFGSTLLSSGGESTFTFRAAGTFTYICTIHDVMLGRVEVAPVVAVETGREWHAAAGAAGHASLRADRPVPL